jgi:TolB protein
MGSHGTPGRCTSVIVVVSSLVLLAPLALVACGGSGTTSSTSPSSVSQSTAAASPSAAPLPAPTVAGTIAFEKVTESGDYQGETFAVSSDIYVVRADGSGLKMLAKGSGVLDHPSWSPDGSRLVYIVSRAGDPGASGVFWVMNADGSGKKRLTKVSAGAADPAWSPDGRQIAFSGDGICVINVDGSGLRRVTRPSGGKAPGESQPAWAPDDRILFLSLGDVWSTKLDGTGLVQLTKIGNVADFGLSPDGKSLALDNNADGVVEVVATRGGGTPVRLLDPVSDFSPDDPYAAPAWTPDGRALAVAGTGPKGSLLYVVNADGSGLSAVPGVEAAAYPAWRP